MDTKAETPRMTAAQAVGIALVIVGREVVAAYVRRSLARR